VKGGLSDIVDVEVSENLYSSDKLGLQRVPASVLGAAVHADAGLMDQLMDFFHFHRYPCFVNAKVSPKGPKVKIEKAPMPEGDIAV
jgi:hypothetical protein